MKGQELGISLLQAEELSQGGHFDLVGEIRLLRLNLMKPWYEHSQNHAAVA